MSDSYYERNAEKVKARSKAYYYANHEKIRKHQNERRTPEIERAYQLKKKFGITQGDYERMLAEQGGACAICKTSKPGRKDQEHFAIDHDHATGKVRGLLCVQCNTAAGNLRDSPDLCIKMAEYLRKHGAP